jgi:hypothetical protein
VSSQRREPFTGVFFPACHVEARALTAIQPHPFQPGNDGIALRLPLHHAVDDLHPVSILEPFRHVRLGGKGRDAKAIPASRGAHAVYPAAAHAMEH